MHIGSISVSHGTTPAVVQPRAAPAGAPVDEAQRQTSPAARDPQIGRSEATAQETTALSEAEVRQLRELKACDREVLAHEQAHGCSRSVHIFLINKHRTVAITPSAAK